MSRGIHASLLAVVFAATQLFGQTAQQPPSSSSSSKHGQQSVPHKSNSLEPGFVSKGLYHNPAFGFSCKIPAGWVLRTDDMNAQSDTGSDKTNPNETATDAGKDGRVLLTAFSRPPEAKAADVNASILIAAESTSAYPGLKAAAQYFDPVTEVAKAQGFEVDEEPYEFTVDAKTLVRGDFKKDVGTRVMRQSTLVLLQAGYALSFTFIGGTEDEIEELVEGLSFGPTGKR